MSQDDQDLEEGTLGYIMLDLISCGLGGAILLGVILSVPRYQAPGRQSTAPYLVVRVEVGPKVNPDRAVLPNLWIKPPGQSHGFDLPLEQFNLETGRRRRAAEVAPESGLLRSSAARFYVSGFYRHDEGLAETKADGRSLFVPLYQLRITQPPAGDWEFRVRYQNRRDLAEHLADTQIPSAWVTMSVSVGQAGGPRPQEEKLLKIGDLSKPLTVRVKPWQPRADSGQEPAK